MQSLRGSVCSRCAGHQLSESMLAGSRVSLRLCQLHQARPGTVPPPSRGLRGLASRQGVTCCDECVQLFAEEVGAGNTVVFFHAKWYRPCVIISREVEAFYEKSGHGVPSGAHRSPPYVFEAEPASCLWKLMKFASVEAAVSSGALAVIQRLLSCGIRFVPVDTDEELLVSALHDIRSVPTFVAYRRGNVVGRLEGCDTEKLQQLIDELLVETSESF